MRPKAGTCERCASRDVADLGSYLECRGCGHGFVPGEQGADSGEAGAAPGESVPADRALEMLDATQQLAAGLLDSRWSDVREALAHGAGVDRVGEAMGLASAQVVAGLLGWVDRAVRSGGLDRTEADRVRALVADAQPAPSSTDERQDRASTGSGPVRPDARWPGAVLDSWGQPRCLPGCRVPDVWDHLCVARVATLAQADLQGPRRAVAVEVEVDQDSHGRHVVLALLDDDGRYWADPIVLPVTSVPALTTALLDAHRVAR